MFFTKKIYVTMAAVFLLNLSLVVSPGLVSANTVNIKGNTQARMYGFSYAEYSWNKQMGGDPDNSNIPVPDSTAKDSKLYQDTYNKVNYGTKTWKTRIGFVFKNSDADIKGRIEGDFAHSENFRLRRAYVKHNFNKFYLLVGQEWVLEHVKTSISAANEAPVGMNEQIKRVPQVRLGGNLYFGVSSLNLALAFENGGKKAVAEGYGQTYNTAKDSFALKTGYSAAEVNRVVMPYVAAKAEFRFETGFAEPASLSAWGSVIPVYISDTVKGKYLSDESKTSYSFGAYAKIPVSMATFGASYLYTYGAVGYDGVRGTKWAPASYYYNKQGSIKATSSNAFGVNAKVKLIPHWSLGVEYGFAEFENDDVFSGLRPKVRTYTGQLNVKTTKYTNLAIEYRYIKAQDFNAVGSSDDSYSGSQIFALYKYYF